MAGRGLTEEGCAGEEREDRDATSFNGLAATFFAIDEDDSSEDLAAFSFDGVDGLQGGSTRGDHIIHNDDGVATLEIAFDAAATAVILSFLADGEDLEEVIRFFQSARHADGQGDGISAHGHAADARDLREFREQFLFDEVPTDGTDEGRADRVKSRDTAIDIEVRRFARSEREGACADRLFKENGFELRFEIVHKRCCWRKHRVNRCANQCGRARRLLLTTRELRRINIAQSIVHNEVPDSLSFCCISPDVMFIDE